MKPEPPSGKIFGFRSQPGESAHPRVQPGSYYELATAHIRAHGGEGIVIERDKAEQRQQWRAWIAYFAWLDDQTTPRGHKVATFQSLKKLTAPTAWPIEFDASAPPAPLPERPEQPLTPERRRALAAILRQAVAHLGMPEEPRRIGFERSRSPGEAEAARRHFEARLPELAAEYAAKPPQDRSRPRQAIGGR
jgi:hypothetical protein